MSTCKGLASPLTVRLQSGNGLSEQGVLRSTVDTSKDQVKIYLCCTDASNKEARRWGAYKPDLATALKSLIAAHGKLLANEGRDITLQHRSRRLRCNAGAAERSNAGASSGHSSKRPPAASPIDPAKKHRPIDPAAASPIVSAATSPIGPAAPAAPCNTTTYTEAEVNARLRELELQHAREMLARNKYSILKKISFLCRS